MDHNTKFSPIDFFLYLGLVAALYVSTGSILALLFNYVDALFPDKLEGMYQTFSSPIRFAMSALVVAFPLLIVFTRIVNNRAREDVARMNLVIRKWLLFLTLFIAGAVIAGDLIFLINTFLGGELNTRFILKVIVVLAVFGSIFAYYLKDIRGYWREHKIASQTVGVVAGVALIAVIVSGFFIIGSPFTQRLVRFDEQRVSGLQTIQWQIVNYWQQKGKIPAELSLLEDPISGFRIPKDPDTGASYGYRVLEADAFELCATFNRATTLTLTKGDTARAPMPAFPVAVDGFPMNENWAHDAGDVCFTRTIDSDLYPVRPQKI